jgi:hypothetical protein
MEASGEKRRMQTARRRRTRWAIAASALAHVAVVAAALLYRPHLTSPIELAAGPMETVIPVLMTPRSHVARPAETPRAAVPLTRPAKPAESAQPATPSLPGPQTAQPSPPGPSAPAAEGEAAAAPDIRLALRHGATGCSSALQAGMTREERERCDERLAVGVKTAPFMQMALEPRMRAYYDAVIKAKAPDKPWTPNRAIGALGRFSPEPRVSSSGDHLPGVGCFFPFTYGEKQTAKQKKAARLNALPHALWIGRCFIEPPKGSLDPEVDVPVP